ncbi:deaminase [Bradyrhizobium elkanii]|uniref:deoxycytidylate deaminase n=1 Tax=Bradyrhizobium elkanii TaxID=29448 RepID=UPI0027121A51|nr:deaminase [Bradyrhizobium elkanii]WLA44136.1 deaminase [Bradyrhizobium elkanii]
MESRLIPGSRPQVSPAFPHVSAFLRSCGLVSIADALATRVANSGLTGWFKPSADPELEIARVKKARWDRYFLNVAQAVSTASKDPSTKVGAVIVRPDRTMASFGYNGFPRGIADTEERLNNREVKYDLVVHGEINAILTAREPLHGYTLYTWPFITCKRCSLHVIQAGIKRVVAPELPEHLKDRWAASVRDAGQLYDEAGVSWALIDTTEVE